MFTKKLFLISLPAALPPSYPRTKTRNNWSRFSVPLSLPSCLPPKTLSNLHHPHQEERASSLVLKSERLSLLITINFIILSTNGATILLLLNTLPHHLCIHSLIHSWMPHLHGIFKLQSTQYQQTFRWGGMGNTERNCHWLGSRLHPKRFSQSWPF